MTIIGTKAHEVWNVGFHLITLAGSLNRVGMDGLAEEISSTGYRLQKLSSEIQDAWGEEIADQVTRSGKMLGDTVVAVLGNLTEEIKEQ